MITINLQISDTHGMYRAERLNKFFAALKVTLDQYKDANIALRLLLTGDFYAPNSIISGATAGRADIAFFKELLLPWLSRNYPRMTIKLYLNPGNQDYILSERFITDLAESIGSPVIVSHKGMLKPDSPTYAKAVEYVIDRDTAIFGLLTPVTRTVGQPKSPFLPVVEEQDSKDSHTVNREIISILLEKMRALIRQNSGIRNIIIMSHMDRYIDEHQNKQSYDSLLAHEISQDLTLQTYNVVLHCGHTHEQSEAIQIGNVSMVNVGCNFEYFAFSQAAKAQLVTCKHMCGEMEHGADVAGFLARWLQEACPTLGIDKTTMHSLETTEFTLARHGFYGYYDPEFTRNPLTKNYGPRMQDSVGQRLICDAIKSAFPTCDCVVLPAAQFRPAFTGEDNERVSLLDIIQAVFPDHLCNIITSVENFAKILHASTNPDQPHHVDGRRFLAMVSDGVSYSYEPSENTILVHSIHLPPLKKAGYVSIITTHWFANSLIAKTLAEQDITREPVTTTVYDMWKHIGDGLLLLTIKNLHLSPGERVKQQPAPVSQEAADLSLVMPGLINARQELGFAAAAAQEPPSQTSPVFSANQQHRGHPFD